MTTSVKTKKSMRAGSRNKLIFYSLFISIPVLHFLIFYVYINFGSILLAFQSYAFDGLTGYTASFAGFDNFVAAWTNIWQYSYRITNALIHLGVTVVICMPLALLFSFYLYKNYLMSGFFKVILFMPQLLSGVILGLLYRYIVTDVYLFFAKAAGSEEAMGLLSQPDKQLATVIVFNVLMSFGVNILTYTSTMSGINGSLIESAQLDGANSMQEFIFIVLPMIYPTIVTLFIVGVSHVFTNQVNLYTLYGGNAGSNSTMGYFLYVQAKDSELTAPREGVLSYPVLSAMGLILTAIILPISMGLRHVLNKYGPSAD
ncbi:MAG: sugar ABC transporter permease [Clostridia bacterium]|nr:sugar ABC transporter permease [Clostridia bacterium]